MIRIAAKHIHPGIDSRYRNSNSESSKETDMLAALCACAILTMSGPDSLIFITENNPVAITQYSIGYVEFRATNRTDDTVTLVPMAGSIYYTDTTGVTRTIMMELTFGRSGLLRPFVPPHSSRIGILRVHDEELEEFKDPVGMYAILPVGVYTIEADFRFEVFSNSGSRPLNSGMPQRFTLRVLPADEAIHEEIRGIRNTILENRKSGLLDVFTRMRESVSDPCYEYFLHALDMNNFFYGRELENYYRLVWDIIFNAVDRIPDTCYGLESFGQLRFREWRLRQMGRADPRYEALLRSIESDSGDGLFQRALRSQGIRSPGQE
jgi:hypothetical protein